jgi:transposase-like protein
MSKSLFSAPHFNDEAAAYAYVEARVWPHGRVCPHCGVVDRSGTLKGKSNRVGLYKCYACRKPFSVKIGTIFEASHIALRDWLTAIHLICSSKKGISSNQLHRTLGITLKSAWFMSHRIREAMAQGALNPFGSTGGAVESDETYMTRRRRKGDGDLHDTYKTKVLTLIDRETKQVKSAFIPNTKRRTIMKVVNANVSREACMMTDQARHYKGAFRAFAEHQAVDHSKEEYVRGEAHTNTAEGYFSIFKKGMKAVYQHCDEKHLHRYLAEFDFRYNNRVAHGVNDSNRSERAITGAVGKRLTYRTTRANPASQAV